MPDHDSDELLERAKAYAWNAHRGQTRDDGRPYATHPEAVAEILRHEGVHDPNVLAAAYLHDVLEDTRTTVAEMRAEFGDAVTALVQEMTNPGNRLGSFEDKHAALIEHARAMSPAARQIKLADRLHNLSEMRVWPIHKRRRYARVTFDLLEALQPWPSEKLARAVADLARSCL